MKVGMHGSKSCTEIWLKSIGGPESGLPMSSIMLKIWINFGVCNSVKGFLCDQVSSAMELLSSLDGFIFMGAMPFIYDSDGRPNYKFAENQRLMALFGQYDGLFPITQAARQYEFTKNLNNFRRKICPNFLSH